MNESSSALPWAEKIILPKNSLFQTPDDVKKGAFFLQSGLLRLFRLKEDGKAFTLGLLGAGDVFGELGSLSLGLRSVYIEAVQETTIWAGEEKLANELLGSCPPFLRQMISCMSERLIEQSERMERLALDPVRDRVLHLLIQMCTRFGREDGAYWKLTVPLSHQEIANMVGATRETVSVVLGHLAEERILLMSRLSFALHRSLLDDSHCSAGCWTP